MFERRSLRLPITLGVVMIVLIVLLIVGWVLLAVFGALKDDQRAGLYWALLSVGTTSLTFVLVGVVMYLTLSIKTINLSRRQSNFIDSVTHELKSPIASLKLYLQTLSRRQLSVEEQARFYQSMLEDTERLDSLINHLLDAARLEKDRTPAETEEIELAKVLQGCAEEVCLRYRVSQDVVQLDLQPCIVKAVRVDLELIFRNLIDNAVKYAGEGPQVEVSLRPMENDRVIVRVSDNGRGISAAQRRKIFGRFVRLGSELERDKPGTGLGLYIVRTLVHRLGGQIKVRDREKGPGTTFEAQFPGKAAESSAPPAEQPLAAPRLSA
jgi:signal transduction histidine kinase